jgi:hypothetical protein
MQEQPDRDLTEGMKSAIADELLPGERLVWAGRPSAASGRAVKLVLIVGVLPLAVGLGLIAWAAADQQGGARLGIGIVVVIVGVVFAAASLLAWALDRHFRRLTCYALTDRRAITWVAEPFGRIAVQSFRPPDLGSMYRKENPDGSGDLILQERMVPLAKGQAVAVDKGFLKIDGVREVEQLVRKLLLKQE